LSRQKSLGGGFVGRKAPRSVIVLIIEKDKEKLGDSTEQGDKKNPLNVLERPCRVHQWVVGKK